jgi:hypothetical protein
MEIKQISGEFQEIKLLEQPGQFSGYASVFGKIDLVGDTIAAGAYKGTLRRRRGPFQMLYNHQRGMVIGKWIKAAEDERGLYVTGELTPNHSQASDVYASLKHGALDALSIGYQVKKFEETESGRLLKEIELVEISVVDRPADEHARIDLASVKNMTHDEIGRIANVRDVRTFLGELGFSKEKTDHLIRQFKAALSLGDPDELAAKEQQLKAFREKVIDLKAENYRLRFPLPN